MKWTENEGKGLEGKGDKSLKGLPRGTSVLRAFVKGVVGGEREVRKTEQQIAALVRQEN